jgi:glycosidase
MKKYLALALLFAACSGEVKQQTENQEEITEVVPPSEWVENATIYEVNVRQHTAEGTFKAFENHIDRLHDLGVDILWFMPIQPIGKLNRKAVGDTFVQDMPEPDYDTYWGSPYSIQNYTAVHPRYGSLDDFKAIVDKCHSLGMKVVLDWVANHTAWDNPWMENKGWHTTNEKGEVIHPEGTDWTDVADLNYDNPEMRLEMIKSMKYWVEECDIDGFRCDVAMEVPTDFWEQARDSLEKVKALWMLAESEAHKPDQFNKAFDAYYGWEMHHVFNKLYEGEKGTSEILRVVKEKDSINGTRVFPMNFITNHDENSWNGTIQERLGESWRAMGVLSYALRGMPLIYTGQEAGLNHRLSFFGKDSVNWDAENAEEFADFYKKMNDLKEQKAWAISAPYTIDTTYENKDLFILTRGENDPYRVVINMSGEQWHISGHDVELTTGYTEDYSYNLVDVKDMNGNPAKALGPWGFVILKK